MGGVKAGELELPHQLGEGGDPLAELGHVERRGKKAEGLREEGEAGDSDVVG